MDGVAYLRRLLIYDDWANRETASSLRESRGEPERAVRLLAHIVGCEWLWLGRLRRSPLPAEVWPDVTLDQCDMQLPRLRAAWDAYLATLTEVRLQHVVDYTNTKGEAFQSKVQDILTHVAMHGTYHRAQIASEVRAAGRAPANTDFIHATREGFVA